MSSIRACTCVLAGLLASGCVTTVRGPEVPAAALADGEQSWANVLHSRVDEQGRVDFVGIAEEPSDLDRWVAQVGAVSPASDPERYPTKRDQLAWYIDAYNGLAMYGVIYSGVLPEQKVRFFLLRKYTVGGEEMSLYALENDVVRPYGDARIHFALNCMSVGGPRLPREPWSGPILDEQLDAAAFEFFGAEQHLRVDDDARTVHVSEILDFFTEDFVSEDTTLIDYINRYRSPPIPADYKVEFIPYDWTLNKQAG